MNIFEIINLRSEYEELTLNLRIPGDKKAGTVENIRWFLENAEERNKRKKDYPKARKLAEEIMSKV